MCRRKVGDVDRSAERSHIEDQVINLAWTVGDVVCAATDEHFIVRPVQQQRRCAGVQPERVGAVPSGGGDGVDAAADRNRVVYAVGAQIDRVGARAEGGDVVVTVQL